MNYYDYYDHSQVGSLNPEAGSCCLLMASAVSDRLGYKAV